MAFTLPFPQETWIRIPWGIDPDHYSDILDSVGDFIDTVELSDVDDDERAAFKSTWLGYVERALGTPSSPDTVNRVLRMIDGVSADYCQVDVSVKPAMSKDELRTFLTADQAQSFHPREVLDTDLEFAGVRGLLGRSVIPRKAIREFAGLNSAFALETELFTVLGFALPKETVVIEMFNDDLIGQALTHDDVTALLAGARQGD